MQWMKQRESVIIQVHDDTSTLHCFVIQFYGFYLSGDMFNVVPLGNQVSHLFSFLILSNTNFFSHLSSCSGRHVCNGREATTEELVSCYNGTNWKGVSLQDFIDCPSNLAINRQTRMLADLSLVGCYNLTLLGTKERESIMLESAKRNLRKMSFFGICEKQSISGYLFEKTFKMKFTKPFLQLNETRSSVALELLSDQVLQQIKDLNRLDMELYSYAVSLMQERFIRLKHQDSQFKDNFIRLSQKPLQVDEADERMMKRIEKERASVRVRPHRPSPEVLSPSTYFTYL